MSEKCVTSTAASNVDANHGRGVCCVCSLVGYLSLTLTLACGLLHWVFLLLKLSPLNTVMDCSVVLTGKVTGDPCHCN